MKVNTSDRQDNETLHQAIDEFIDKMWLQILLWILLQSHIH